jgi:hypothetical protein
MLIAQRPSEAWRIVLFATTLRFDAAPPSMR